MDLWQWDAEILSGLALTVAFFASVRRDLYFHINNLNDMAGIGLPSESAGELRQ